MVGRSFLLQVPAPKLRAYLQDVLLLPQTTDCVIQGHRIRLILKKQPANRFSCQSEFSG